MGDGETPGSNGGESPDAGPEADRADRDRAGDDRRLWLVERTYTDKGLVSLVYATADGAYSLQRQRSTNVLRQTGGVTTAIEADAERLQRVEDADTREQYAEEAGRMADRHDPDETV